MRDQGTEPGGEQNKYNDALLSCSFLWMKCSIITEYSLKCVSELFAWGAKVGSIYPLVSASFWLRLAMQALTPRGETKRIYSDA